VAALISAAICSIALAPDRSALIWRAVGSRTPRSLSDRMPKKRQSDGSREPIPQDGGDDERALSGDRPAPARRARFDGHALGSTDDGRDRQSGAFVIIDLDIVRPAGVGGGGDHQDPEKMSVPLSPAATTRAGRRCWIGRST